MDEVYPTAPRAAEPAPLPVGIVCPDCGYDLRGSTSARCPECGFGLDVLRTRETLIPWSHRRELGWFNAYWKTVWLVLRHQKQFCAELNRSVSYADAQSFRWITTGLAYFPILVGSAAWAWYAPGTERDWWFRAVLLATSLLVLVLVPSLASCFFHPRTLTVEQQNRAVALSYYAWTPLAFTPVALFTVLAGLLIRTPYGSMTEDALRIISRLTHLLALAGGVEIVADIAKHLFRERFWTRFKRISLILLLSAGVALLGILIPASLFYLLVIYHSLR